MVTINPRFWATPLRYCRWAARERPNYFWPVVIGACAPLTFVVGPPIRKLLGDENPPAIPMTYPGAYHPRSLWPWIMTNNAVPVGPRKQLTGYDDDASDQ
ncbi:nadh-ubiquinone oxidoreductase kda subunit [Ophiostoma piceae UAMH 11346]|uniref:Nadh-ubiquinone oxidoreductase kDa subunit n=1 Tax=Ophiostoma piceae (strain UAMH 11346) TaxID=1262450 RepID=S3CG59_OPHP1|nr:nadh-ubiquinone oxidoreductase kda subunit [Ophiostoma piceae UAMH 11346]